MLAIVATAKQFSIRPSELMAIADPVLALAFDLAATVRLQQELKED
jgi:hypothetical protein